jgi:hypothetical protein
MTEHSGSTADIIRNAVSAVAERCARYPGLIQTEGDAQAELHAELLELFSGPAMISAGDGLLLYPHHVWPLVGSRAYREISAGASRATPRADITILAASAQLEPKNGGAPARFKGPVDALIEIKLDIDRSRPAPISPRINRDFEKWQAEVESGAASAAVAVVFTDRPDDYRHVDPQKVVIAELSGTKKPPHLIAPEEAVGALDDALSAVIKRHGTEPLGMLREKDFETRITRILRDTFGERASAVRTQSRVRCRRTGRLRPLDVAIFSGGQVPIAAALEIKTSHSRTFRTIGRAQLEDEADFLTGMIEDGLCSAARVAIFRYGTKPLCDDVAGWNARRPQLPLFYSEC